MGAYIEDTPQRSGLAALVSEFQRNESGATAIEYALIVSLIFLAIVGAVRAFSESTSTMYNTIDETLTDK